MSGELSLLHSLLHSLGERIWHIIAHQCLMQRAYLSVVTKRFMELKVNSGQYIWNICSLVHFILLSIWQLFIEIPICFPIGLKIGIDQWEFSLKELRGNRTRDTEGEKPWHVTFAWYSQGIFTQALIQLISQAWLLLFSCVKPQSCQNKRNVPWEWSLPFFLMLSVSTSRLSSETHLEPCP